jgi:hypothetical protein
MCIGRDISLASVHDIQYSIILISSDRPAAVVLTPVSTILRDILCVN